MLYIVRDQFIKFTVDINELNALENPSFVLNYSGFFSVVQSYEKIKYDEKTIFVRKNSTYFIIKNIDLIIT